MKKDSPLPLLRFSTFSLIPFLFLGVSSSVLAADEVPSFFTLSNPTENETFIGKKPEFTLNSSVTLGQEPLLVLLDDMDVSGLIQRNGQNISFQPVMVLPAGDHNLYITGTDAEGNPIEQEFFFSTRHSESFKEAYSNNELSIIYRGVTDHFTRNKESQDISAEDEWIEDDTTTELEKVDNFAGASIDGYLATESVVREGNWTTSFTGNLRYFDQRADIFEPEKRGLSVIDLLLASSYSGEKLNVDIGLGDNSIDESPNTIDYLTRRGLMASMKYENLTVTGFGVIADEQYNDISHVGLRFNSNDHIMGISAKMDFLENQMSLKAIYSRGGENGDSIGSWSAEGSRKGDVAGLVFKTDFFAGQLLTEVEYDESSIEHTSSDTEASTDDIDSDFYTDSDSESSVGKKRDKAYRILIGGLKSVYNYELSYEYTGPDYEVVGNQGLTSDRAGYSFVGGFFSEEHSINLFANKFWDNVDNDALYQRVNSMGGGIEYSYAGWQRFPVSISYERGSQRSEDEPLDVDETAVDIDTTTITLGYQDGPWVGDFNASFSRENDKGPSNTDNEIVSVFISPGYSSEVINILPSWSYNTVKDIQSSVRTDTHTWTLDLQAFFFSEQLICELGGTYDRSTTDDDTTDSRSFQGYGRATYRFQELWNVLNPAIALEYTREYQKDAIADSSTQEDIVTVILSSTLPYSF